MTLQTIHVIVLCLLLVLMVLAVIADWYISSLWVTPWSKLSRRDKWGIGTGTVLMSGKYLLFGFQPFLDTVLLFVGGGLIFWAFSFLPDSTPNREPGSTP